MNETLEAMAQTIFKSWFVDFDPVHLKATCKSEEELESQRAKLGISKEILELFPSEFEESEMGMVPKGWEVKSLDKIAHYQNGLALQKFRPKDENNFLPVLKIAQLKKGYADAEEKADADIKPECIVNNGDVVFSWSGSLVVDIWCGGKVALNQHLFKVTSNSYSKWFYYCWTKQHLDNFQRVAAAKAVTMGHIKRSHLAEAMCVVPDATILDTAESVISPLLEKLILNRLENNNLIKTRDALLRKLLSGELDISSLEEGI
jgi:type I restriction enzyme S subunit